MQPDLAPAASGMQLPDAAAETSRGSGRRRRRGRMKRLVRLAISVIGLAAIAMVARDLDTEAVAQSIRGVDPVLGVMAALVMIGGKLGAKIVRSQILLVEQCRRIGVAPPTWATTARLLAASHAAGQLAWGPLGFTVRTFALRDGGMPLGAVARVHVAERIAEALGIAAIALAALVIEPSAILGSWFGRVLLALLVLLALAGGALAISGPLRARLAHHAGTGGAIARSSIWALASSMADIAVLMLAARGMLVELDVATAMLAFLAVNGACTIPVTPAQLGVQESALVVVLATAGIAAPQALACALAYRAAHVVPLALIGLPALLGTWARRRKVRSSDGRK
jgi:uncharacterized membrane protein YbhN (UPF0104 family)